MLWVALLLPNEPPPDDALRGLATWALQFTPRVAALDEAVVMEVEASTRLFGGRRALRDRVVQEAPQLGVLQVAWAPTSLAAVAIARSGKDDGIRRPLPAVLDQLPMETLSATAPHLKTLTQLGCRTLGDVRRLPRGGISRRFGAALLSALDQAYHLRPEVHEWIVLPERFKARLELMSRVEVAPAMLFAARRLILQMCGWLSARHSGTTAFVLRWAHDTMRSSSAGEGGEAIIRTGALCRDVEHLCRLLAENLAKVQLAAPVGDLELEALEVEPLSPQSDSLLPDATQQGETLALALERIAARLGPERVLRPVPAEDHRLEWMQHWQPAPLPLPKKRVRRTKVPQPTFVLPQPQRLAMRGDRPMYQGVLHMLAGPHRVEGGWWHRVPGKDGAESLNVTRDYWVALSEHCGLLWVYQERLVTHGREGGEASAPDGSAWYLQGSFS